MEIICDFNNFPTTRTKLKQESPNPVTLIVFKYLIVNQIFNYKVERNNIKTYSLV